MNKWSGSYIVYFNEKDIIDIDIEGFNTRILKMVEGLTINRFEGMFNYEVKDKTYSGVSIIFYWETVIVRIPILSNEFDYKLADLLLRYLVFYGNGYIENKSLDLNNQLNPPYDKILEGDNYCIIEKPALKAGNLILKAEENGEERN
ncbi:hypothetical protein [Chryseobacterium fistulae]|uniref:Uncharacterized protein n=1 Tax=Chryseobacterium fistulae TaxID=2675058 RepID=A0A6N4XS30_9FLAO|nr:hypothetical protein [Chryseobacterium fistulae]CAA7386966.1 hypothetical protein CHRY9393_01267 [Chryseobacterium fistulae]